MNINEREILDRIKADARFGAASNPTRSFLREEVLLLNGTSQYKFSFDQGNSIATLPQKRLSQKDVFWAHAMGLFILVEHKDKPGSGVLFSYPNPYELRKSWADPALAIESPATDDARALDVETVYNGTVTTRSNQTIIHDGIESAMFRSVPQTQLSPINDQDQRIHGNVHFGLEPNFILSGKNKNEIAVDIPSYLGSAVKKMAANNANFQVKLVCVLQGFICPGFSESYKG